MKRFFLFSALVALFVLPGCSSSENAAPSFDEVYLSRRSIRTYDPDKTITKAELQELFKAAQNAPSWANFQPSKYYIALSKEMHDAVSEHLGANKDRAKNAPVLMVSTFEKGKSGFFQGQQTNELADEWGAHDNGLSDAYLILKARAMGFDTLIMGMRDSDGLRQVLGIPENETIMAVIALGYRAENPREPVHKPLDEFIKFF